MRQAITHKGFALVDIMSPCVTFNKINTFAWFRARVKPVGSDHDPSDFDAAVGLVSRGQEEIPTGLIYKADRPAFNARFAALNGVERSDTIQEQEAIALRSAAYAPERVRSLFKQFK